MARKNRRPTITVFITGMVFAVAACCCHGESSPSWSARVAYTRVMASSKTGPDYNLDRDLFMQQLPEGDPVRLTDWTKHPLLAPYVGGPRWSPNGEYILLMGSLKGHEVINPQNDWPSYPWILDVRTKNLRRIGKTKDRWYMDVEWLPNQRGIVARVVYGKKPQFGYYTDLRADVVMSGGETRLVMIDIKTGRERIIRRNLSPGLFWVLPINQKVITYDRGNDRLKLFNLSTGKWRTLLKSAPLDVAEISPEGKRFAFHNKGVLRVLDIHSGKLQVLYNARDVSDIGQRLIWSPNGRWIALRHSVGDITSIDPPVASSTSYTTLIEASTGKSRLLLEDSKDVIMGWTRDSKNILLKRNAKADGPFPYDAKTVMTVYPISGSAPSSTVEIDGYHGNIDIF